MQLVLLSILDMLADSSETWHIEVKCAMWRAVQLISTSELISETYRFAFYLFLLSALVFVTEREMRQGEWIVVERWTILKTLIVQSQTTTADFIFLHFFLISFEERSWRLCYAIYLCNEYLL